LGVSWRGRFISQLNSHQPGTLLLRWLHRGLHKLQNGRKKNKIIALSREHIAENVSRREGINKTDRNGQGGGRGRERILYNFT